jgi:hypothetical protein
MVLLSTFQENAVGISLRYADACLKRSFLKVVLKSSSLLDRIRMAMTLPEIIRLKNSNCCTAKIQYRKFKRNIPRKGNAQPQSDFHILVSVSGLYIPRSVCLFCCRKMCGQILGINKSITDT